MNVVKAVLLEESQGSQRLPIAMKPGVPSCESIMQKTSLSGCLKTKVRGLRSPGNATAQPWLSYANSKLRSLSNKI